MESPRSTQSSAAGDAAAPPASRNRCAIAVKGDVQYLFVVVPKPKPPPKVELEDLLFFETPAAPPPAPKPPPPPTDDLYCPMKEWLGGSVTIPLEVTSRGQLQRSVVFPATEFASLAQARQQCGPFTSFQEFPALFGCLRIDKVYMLVATSITTAVRLPFAGVIHKVEGTAWVPFELRGVAPVRVSPADRTRLSEFREYTYYKGYYYSDDADVMLPFPFTKPDACAAPGLACDWSAHLREPFAACSLPAACSKLIRGFAGERVCTLKDGVELHLVLLGRQSNVNPGPRYLGRGLNSANGAGNDHYYEYILWKHYGPDTVTFTRHSILRGTIPVHWTTQVSMSISEPAMIFSPDKAEVIHGSTPYFENTFQKLRQVMLLDTRGATTANPQVRCISLLRLNPQNGEDVLARYFLDAVRAADPVIRGKFAGGGLDLVHVDWLNLIKEYGIQVATSTFWEASMGFLGTTTTPEDSMMTVGMMRRTGEVDRLITQSRFVRINCADSLDRTNLGCFFTCLQLSIAMLVTQRIPFSSFAESPLVPALDASEEIGQESTYAGAYAPVSGAKQTVPKPFVNTWNDVRDPKRIPPVIVRALAELFVLNGDSVAMLYTNSAAMHGNILRGVCGMRLQGYNAVIATQRKYENVFEDRNKFRSIELLLGRNQGDHFPSISDIFLLRPVPYTQWACAMVVVGVPDGVTVADIDAAVRRAWETGVTPQLARRQLPPIESTALCFTVTLPKPSEKQEHDELAQSMKQVSFDNAPPANDPLEQATQENGAVRTLSERLAVVEFDPDLCSVVDAATMVRQQGFLSLGGRNCILAPYAYPIQTGSDSVGMGGAVKNVGTSLKRGFKNFVRGLN
ncbi:putative synaptojanin (N-terminal domain) putativeinositol 5'-phosphatase [Leptomonas pyrrhocoris]|uniref:Putative synaptojanin (N-terminal domain) putativeinositol 5'-phosphatase n=1 Tax=Leptomonas pyrrhocoris TaxID=157538 RepID=A0A0M9FWH6_LEPPY|nr:putative synaptojanin (N-terminal domain) putativeinositol 5'-phosphatase [Leptomonas pyrrhocoris]KPA77387.1 putative synaptojanin (N-terminal domain) putativeinositol 5'-phosphatase [Leptomonas pyrrhocoris]|eukprot:XP_015655826.1 putative synaptojanin (N-terminal domain) putativeinositol 5'-phosphatase [Leptomonas pyrrhocoris]